MYFGNYARFFAMLFLAVLVVPAIVARPDGEESESGVVPEARRKPKPKGKKSCVMTNKFHRNCTGSSCRNGGGRCVLNPRTNRCNQAGDWNKIPECKLNCRCISTTI